MRELSEINKDINATQAEKNRVDEHLHQLYIERGQRLQYDFEQRHGLKRGDLVDLGRFGKVFYDYVKPFGTFPWAYGRKVKKDGTPSKTLVSFDFSVYDNCKIIGHAELEDLR